MRKGQPVCTRLCFHALALAAPLCTLTRPLLPRRAVTGFNGKKWDYKGKGKQVLFREPWETVGATFLSGGPKAAKKTMCRQLTLQKPGVWFAVTLNRVKKTNKFTLTGESRERRRRAGCARVLAVVGALARCSLPLTSPAPPSSTRSRRKRQGPQALPVCPV